MDRGARALVALSLLSACCTPARSVSPGDERIADIHRAKCGACHRRVEPGARTRRELEVALGRHRARVVLADSDWAALLDYLGGPLPPPTGKPDVRVPQ